MTSAAWRAACVEQRALERGEQLADGVDLVAQPQAQVGRHLVVARARGVQPLAGFADQRGQAPLDVEVHVLGVERPARSARRRSRGRSRARPRSIAARSRRARMPRAASMRACASDAAMSCFASRRSNDDRSREALDLFVDGLREAAGPGLRLLRHKFQNAAQHRPLSMPSIRQNAYSDVLPDFRNLGVIARVLVAVNAAALVAALFAARDLAQGARALRAGGRAARAAAARVHRRAGRALAAARPAAVLAPAARRWSRSSWRSPRRIARRAARSSPTLPAPDLRAHAGAERAGRRRAARLFPPARQGVLAGARRGAPAGAAGAHPAAFPVQQPERRAVAHPPRPEARRARARGPGGPVPHADVGRRASSCASPTRSRCSSATPSSSSCAWASGCASPGSSTRAPADALLPPLVLQPLLENAVYHGVEPGTGAGRGAGAHRAARRPRAARASRTRTSRSSSSAPATAWRWTTSASACCCSSTPRRASAPAAPARRYRVEIEMPY